MSYSKALLVAACLVVSISFTVAQLRPPFFGLLPPVQGQDLMQCWSSLQSITGCVAGIYTSFLSGRIGLLGPGCCEAIGEVTDKCWPKMFPYSPFYPPMLKQYCAKNEEVAPPATAVANAPSTVKGIESELTSYGYHERNEYGLDPELYRCLTSLQSVGGCVEELAASFFSLQIRLLGPACCQTITTINDKCWPKIFPFNPFFPHLVQDHCSNMITIPSTLSTTAHRIGLH